jgi:hypothetical protein
MALAKDTNLIDLLKDAISKSIQQSVEEEFDKKIKELQIEKNRIVAGTLLNVMKMVDFQQMGERIIFTVREIKS